MTTGHEPVTWDEVVDLTTRLGYDPARVLEVRFITGRPNRIEVVTRGPQLADATVSVTHIHHEQLDQDENVTPLRGGA